MGGTCIFKRKWKVYMLGDLHVCIWAWVKKVSTIMDTTVIAIFDEALEQIPVQKKSRLIH